MPGLLGKKLGMTRVFQDDGRVIPVTLLHCSPSKVIQVKTIDHDGYPAIVLGFEALKKPKKTKKFRFLKEFRVEKPEDYKIGDNIGLDKFKDLKEITVSGISKGKGFAGFIKRHHFFAGPRSHGSHYHREPGSIGARAKPGRVIKGKRMAGRMGHERVTVKHMPVIEIQLEKNLLAVKGPVPGPTGGLVEIRI